MKKAAYNIMPSTEEILKTLGEQIKLAGSGIAYKKACFRKTCRRQEQFQLINRGGKNSAM